MDKQRILVVDDQPGVRRLLYEAFLDDGYEIELAAGGTEALKKLEVFIPQIILLDLKMPGMSGIDTLKEIRRKGYNITVIIMTAYGELDLIKDALKYGVQYYINKPFDLSELRYLVKAVLIGTEGGAPIVSQDMTS